MIIRRVLPALALAFTAAPAPAVAEEPGMVMPLPCTGQEYLVAPVSQPRVDRTHETVAGDRYHENALFLVNVTAVPLDPANPGYAGRLSFRHIANDGTQGKGHAVSSFSMRARLAGTDGSMIRAREVAHISATARPDLDPDALIRVFFTHARCRVR